jgi:hypothetical protein
MSGPTRYVLAISENDDRLHVGPLDDLLPHFGVTRANRHGSAEGLEFYDDEGNPLTITAEDTGQPQFTQLGTGAVTEQLLVDRIAVVLARAQVLLDREDTPPISRFPLLQGDLRTVLAALADALGPLVPADGSGPPTQGNARHMYLHEKGLAH